MASEGIGDKSPWKTRVRKQLYDVPGEQAKHAFQSLSSGSFFILICYMRKIKSQKRLLVSSEFTANKLTGY